MVRVFFLFFSDGKTFSYLKRHENHKCSSTKSVFYCCITNCLTLDGFLKTQSSKGQTSEQIISPHFTGQEPGVRGVMWLSRTQGLLQSPQLCGRFKCIHVTKVLICSLTAGWRPLLYHMLNSPPPPFSKPGTDNPLTQVLSYALNHLHQDPGPF